MTFLGAGEKQRLGEEKRGSGIKAVLHISLHGTPKKSAPPYKQPFTNNPKRRSSSKPT